MEILKDNQKSSAPISTNIKLVSEKSLSPEWTAEQSASLFTELILGEMAISG